MKKENLTPVKVYSDPVHEAKTRIELEKARVSLQACLDIWNGLKLVPCNDIFALIMNPQTVYGNAVNQLAEPPVQPGRFQIAKSVYISTLDVPIPDNLYRAAKSARQLTYSAMPELWTVSESGLNVVLDEAESGALIDSQSVYVSDPLKIELIADLTTLCELMNKVNLKLPEELLRPDLETNGFFRDKFLLTQKSYPGPFSVSLDPAFLRTLLRS
jgi:hypothetical protein